MRTILNTILLMSLCSSARGQEVPDSIKHNPITESDVKLSEVVVTGLTGSQKLKQSPSPVSIISPRQLEAQPSTNIIDVIAHQPGISQVTTGSGISKPVIRGLGYNRVVVVNDGIRQEGQQWGDEHGIEVDPYSVHSVEILLPLMLLPATFADDGRTAPNMSMTALLPFRPLALFSSDTA